MIASPAAARVRQHPRYDGEGIESITLKRLHVPLALHRARIESVLR